MLRSEKKFTKSMAFLNVLIRKRIKKLKYFCIFFIILTLIFFNKNKFFSANSTTLFFHLLLIVDFFMKYCRHFTDGSFSLSRLIFLFANTRVNEFSSIHVTPKMYKKILRNFVDEFNRQRKNALTIFYVGSFFIPHFF